MSYSKWHSKNIGSRIFAHIFSFACLLASLSLFGCGGGGGAAEVAPLVVGNIGVPTIPPAPDTTPPMVSGTSPDNAATGVALNSSVSATFSKAMTNATLNTASFTLRPTAGGAIVTAPVVVSGNTAMLVPSVNLAASTQYTATVSTAATDAAGNALAANFSWSFTTGAAPDTTPPTVSSTSPANAATGIALNSSVSATFSKAMTNSTLSTTSYTLRTTAGGATVTGAVNVSGNTATFTPTVALAGSTQYTATISTAANDAAGNALAANFSWSFTTGAAPDTTPPTVSSTSPANAATGIALNSSVSATFSKAMTNSTLSTTSYALRTTAGGATVTGAVNVSGNTATFAPTASLAGSTQYTATITTAAKDLAGNALAANFTWSFTTGPAAPNGTAMLAWDPAAGTNLSGYRVYYGPAPGTYLQALGQGINVGNVVAYTASGLTAATRYYFAVTAVDATGTESIYSNEVFKDIP